MIENKFRFWDVISSKMVSWEQALASGWKLPVLKNRYTMQYTGLCDRNGKEGYNNDFVKLFDRSIYEILWDDEYATFYLKLVKGNELKNKSDMLQLRFGEIIGNSYENPDLLA